jgi:hypothetical protein
MFVVVVPFTNYVQLLILHSVMIPFMIIHWAYNNNLCFLTLVEKYIRKECGYPSNTEDCYTCRLIEPIYDFKKNNTNSSDFIYLVTIGLWLISISRLVYKYKTSNLPFGEFLVSS